MNCSKTTNSSNIINITTSKTRFISAKVRLLATSLLAIVALSIPLNAQSEADLKARVAELEEQLAAAKAQLAQSQKEATDANERADSAEGELAAAEEAKPPAKIEIGNFKIGGSIRANYTLGDYAPDLDRPSRSDGDGGSFSLDIFRVNVDYANGPWSGKMEYRFYPGYGSNNNDSYNMPHTFWVGYQFQDESQVQVGLNRVPFGPTAYGISQSWFFDQHYYLGLADDMDFGIKYSKSFDKVNLDLAYYYSSEGSWYGENFSSDSVRYSYDVTAEGPNGYKERNQFNLRAIMPIEGENVNSDLGLSLQYGELASQGIQDDGSMFAGSVHAVTKWDNWKLATQLTYQDYDVDAMQDLGTDEMVQYGAFDFATIIPAEAWIAGLSLSYYYETPEVDWLDYVIPYFEYSSVMKEADGFNDSDLLTIGAAWARGGWYIYTDLAYSNGNDFVGNESGYGDNPAPYFTSNRFGSNPEENWEYRFNINFGYYF